MRSSTVNCLRGLVMLSCLIALPVIAVFGLPMPDQVSSWLNRFGLFQEEKKPVAVAPAATVAEDASALPAGPAVGNSFAHSSPLPVLATGSDRKGAFDSSVLPASHEGPEAAAAVPLSANIPANLPGDLPADLSSKLSGDSRTKGVGFFRDIQERLRDLGATYYRLESWGERGEMFHFQCRVAVDGHANFTRHFEATGEDPLTAMDSVLTEIESWKDRRGPMETGAYSR